MRFTKRIFELNSDNDITAYVNSPWQVSSYKEICSDWFCDTEVLYIGVDHYMQYSDEIEERWIFENDSATDQVFQVEYLDATRDLIWGEATQSLLLSFTAGVLLALSAIV